MEQLKIIVKNPPTKEESKRIIDKISRDLSTIYSQKNNDHEDLIENFEK